MSSSNLTTCATPDALHFSLLAVTDGGYTIMRGLPMDLRDKRTYALTISSCCRPSWLSVTQYNAMRPPEKQHLSRRNI